MSSSSVLATFVQIVLLGLVCQLALDRYGGGGDVWSKVHWPTVALVCTSLAAVVHIGQTLFKVMLAFALAAMVSASMLVSVAYIFSSEEIRLMMQATLKHSLSQTNAQ